MCPEKIYDDKDFKKWAVKNHPDKKKVMMKKMRN